MMEISERILPVNKKQHGQQVAHPTAAWLLVVFPIVALIIGPPDLLSEMILAAEMVLVYGFAIFVVSRFKSFKKAPRTRKNAIAVVLCLFSILVGCCTMFLPRVFSR